MPLPRPRRSAEPRKRVKKTPVPRKKTLSREEDALMTVGLEQIYGAEGSIRLDLRCVQKPTRRWMAWACLFLGIVLITLTVAYLFQREWIWSCVSAWHSRGSAMWVAMKAFYR